MNSLQALAVLVTYGFFIFLSAYLGGLVSSRGAMTHTRTQIVVSFVAGFILGIAMFHLLPHGLELISGPHSPAKAMSSMAIGVVAMIFVLHVFRFHQHDFSEEAGHLHGGRGQSTVEVHNLLGVVIGLGLHTLTEGFALGLIIHATFSDFSLQSILPSLAVFLAIVLHKPLDTYSILSMMRSLEHEQKTLSIANVSFSLLCPAIAVASFYLADVALAWQSQSGIGYMLAFAAGAFLCISLSDLLPEIHFHSHDRPKLIGALILGISMAFGLFFLEVIALH